MPAATSNQNGNLDPGPSGKPKRSLLYLALRELGLISLYSSHLDVKLLCAQRFLRGFAFGSTALILVVYLTELGFPETSSGLFMTLTLLGDVVLSFVLTILADGIGRRNILIMGSALMIVSGVVFALVENYWILVLVSVLGVISPSGNEIGPFRAVEESTLAHLSTPQQQTDNFAWYTLMGTFGSAIGPIVCGWATQMIQTHTNASARDSYKVTFVAYSVFGLLKLILSLMLSNACDLIHLPEDSSPNTTTSSSVSETPKVVDSATPSRSSTMASIEERREASETDPLLPVSPRPTTSVPAMPPPTPPRPTLLPKISPSTRPTIYKLVFLFVFDNFASGLVTIAWLSYFFSQKFTLTPGLLGTIFFISAIVASASHLVSASIARRLGLVKTMVLTHLPSAVFLALIPVPNDLPWAAFFLTARSSMAQMDTAPRQAFVAQVLPPAERTTVMGFLNVLKTLAQAVAPALTGAMAQNGTFWISFLVAGALKGLYDLGVLAFFLGMEKKTKKPIGRDDTVEDSVGSRDRGVDGSTDAGASRREGYEGDDEGASGSRMASSNLQRANGQSDGAAVTRRQRSESDLRTEDALSRTLSR